MNAQWTDFITLLKREVVPALGCTEPMSVALAAANCRKLLGQVPTRVSVWVSGNLFKNGMGVGVPGTGMIGLPVAAAVGITGGNPDAGLEVLKTLTPDQVEAAKALLPAIKDVLREAIAAGGSSLKDHVQPTGELGYFQHSFAVYDREGQPCPGCTCDLDKTGGVTRIVQAGRSTFYCAKKQR